MRVCMAVFTDLRYDFRVFREASALVAAGHEVSIISSAFGQEPPPNWDGIEIRLIRLDSGRSLRRSYPAFWRQAVPPLLQSGADVVHAHDLDALCGSGGVDCRRSWCGNVVRRRSGHGVATFSGRRKETDPSVRPSLRLREGGPSR